MTDLQLLQDYTQSRSQEAFAQLVTRHADWVYSLAVRRLSGDAHLAEDVTQAVFLLLSQKAGKLGSSETVLNAWLFKTAQYACSNALRMKMRRVKHEKMAAEMSAELRDAQTDQTWEQIAPALDEMVGRLRSQDRDALLLRFYQRKSMAEVGAALGVSEDAAKKRVARAIDALRETFGRTGITTTASAIATPLLIKTTHAAPAALVALCAAPAAVKTAGILGIAKGAVAMATMKAKLAAAGVIVGSLVVATGVAVVIVQPWKPDASATTAPAPPSNSYTGDTISTGTKLTTGQVILSSSPNGTLNLVNVTTTRPRPADNALVTRQRVMCAANLKSIGQALLLYANDHKGVYPPDLGTLAQDQDVALQVFLCPAVGKVSPKGLGMSPQQIVDWVNSNADYRYISGFTSSADAETVIAFEKDTNEYGDGMNMLFGDGHVVFMPLDQASTIIANSLALAASRGGTLH